MGVVAGAGALRLTALLVPAAARVPVGTALGPLAAVVAEVVAAGVLAGEAGVGPVR